MVSGGAQAKFFVGSQTIATAADLEAWMRRAQANEEFVYCEALEPIRGETWARVRELTQAGYIRPHERKRAGGGKIFFAVRTRRQISVAADPVQAGLSDPATDAVFREFKRAANLDLACPSDADLARRCGLASRDAAQHRVRKLIALKLIASEVAYEGGVPTRVVTICATGKRTRLPPRWAAAVVSAQRDAAQAAGGAK
jgi:hypothetical protein